MPTDAQICELDARSFRGELPERASLEVLREERRQLADGFASRVTVALERRAGGGASRAHGLAFGGEGRRCLMVVVASEASGPHAREVLSGRLGLVFSAVLARLRRMDVEGRVVAHPP